MPSRLPFLDLIRQRVVVLDGAMGSNLQTRTFDLQRDWLGQENISEVLNVTRPEVIQEIHEAFLDVGCDHCVGMRERDFSARLIHSLTRACVRGFSS